MLDKLINDQVDVVRTLVRQLNVWWAFGRSDTVSTIAECVSGFSSHSADVECQRDQELFLDLTFPCFVPDRSTLATDTSAFGSFDVDDFVEVGDDEDFL